MIEYDWCSRQVLRKEGVENVDPAAAPTEPAAAANLQCCKQNYENHEARWADPIWMITCCEAACNEQSGYQIAAGQNIETWYSHQIPQAAYTPATTVGTVVSSEPIWDSNVDRHQHTPTNNHQQSPTITIKILHWQGCMLKENILWCLAKLWEFQHDWKVERCIVMLIERYWKHLKARYGKQDMENWNQ